MRIILFVILFFIFSYPVHAQGTGGGTGATAGKTPGEPAATRIEADEQANVIRFYIAGEEKALLDAHGLHVRDDITYGGVIVDIGKINYPHGSGDMRGADAE